MPSDSKSKFSLPLFAGVDVGGTNIKVGIVDNDGTIVADTKFPTQADESPEVSMLMAKDTVSRLLESSSLTWDEVGGVGLGTPGPMDISAGLILTPNNLPGWRNFPVRERLEHHTGKSVAFSNDASAAAYGEYWIGSGRQYGSLILITLGTGVGGGIILNDLNVEGAHSHGAEVGHITIDTSDRARMCPCGNLGHLEAYASATAVVARCKEALASGKESILNKMTGEASPLSALMVSNAGDQGDTLALELIDETAVYLGNGIATLAHVIDPAAFILGGAMDFGGSKSPLGRRFIDKVIDTVKKQVFPVIADRLVVRFAELGGEAGFVGAAGMAKLQYSKNSQN